MPQTDAELIEKLQTQRWQPTPVFADQDLLIFLLMILFMLAVVVIAARRILQSQPKLVSDLCAKCGGTMKRVHQNRWLRAVTPLLPFRTMYCRACGVKAIRVNPRRERRRRRRSRKR